jgi:nucleoside triphosphate diphosphatase
MGRSVEEATLEEMDALWNEAKVAEHRPSSSRPSEARAGTHTAESRD